MMPPDLTKFGGPELGLAYVGISRVKRTDGPAGLTLLSPLHADHFRSKPEKRAEIKVEYDRLRRLQGAANLVPVEEHQDM